MKPSTLAIGGDSAGGNIAAAVALLARERQHPPIRLQLLISPVCRGSSCHVIKSGRCSSCTHPDSQMYVSMLSAFPMSRCLIVRRQGGRPTVRRQPITPALG